MRASAVNHTRALVHTHTQPGVGGEQWSAFTSFQAEVSQKDQAINGQPSEPQQGWCLFLLAVDNFVLSDKLTWRLNTSSKWRQFFCRRIKASSGHTCKSETERQGNFSLHIRQSLKSAFPATSRSVKFILDGVTPFPSNKNQHHRVRKGGQNSPVMFLPHPSLVSNQSLPFQPTRKTCLRSS